MKYQQSNTTDKLMSQLDKKIKEENISSYEDRLRKLDKNPEHIKRMEEEKAKIEAKELKCKTDKKLNQIKNSIKFLSNSIENYEAFHGCTTDSLNNSIELGRTVLNQEINEFQMLTNFKKK